MRFEEMVADYCRRAKARHTPEQIAFIAGKNQILANENGFVVFAWVLDEFHALFAYAAPGRSFRPIYAELEELARERGIRRIKFSTDRPEVMGRLFRGYKPIAIIMGKELV